MPTLTVSECLRQLNGVLETQVVEVEGEIQGFHVSQGKWIFFSLKDKESIIDCFAFAFRLRIPIEDGMTVRVLATPGIHTRSGRFRLTVERVEVVGEGALKRAFELLKLKLEAEGLFSAARKRALPRFPEHIGLIASEESAAYSDFLKVLQARYGNITVHTAHVPVQGAAAIPAVIGALQLLGTFEPRLDVIVLTRGGGSLEDLMAFNDEVLAREIFRCPVPVVSAIGHERDTTIVDYVADLRASTPSNAAELVVPDRRQVASELRAISEQMESALGRQLMLATHDLDRVTHFYASAMERWTSAARVLMHRVASALPRFEARWQAEWREVVELTRRLVLRIEAQQEQGEVALKSYEQLFSSLSPERLLRRGYSIVRHQGRVVKSVNDVSPGSRIGVTLADGEVGAEVIPS